MRAPSRAWVALGPLALLASALAGCSGERADRSAAEAATPTASKPDAAGPSPTASKPIEPKSAAASAPAGEWQMVSSGEGDGLFFAGESGSVGAGAARVHLFCAADGGLLVNVRTFRAVASEERMTLGAGGAVVTLVADASGDPARGGVSGSGPVPAELAAILAAPAGLSVNYGAQNVGPFPPAPAALARDFVAGCAD